MLMLPKCPPVLLPSPSTEEFLGKLVALVTAYPMGQSIFEGVGLRHEKPLVTEIV
jgi:hypothetical protein